MDHVSSPSQATKTQPAGSASSFINASTSLTVWLTAAYLTALIVILLIYGYPQAYELHFSWYAVPIAVALICNLVAIILINRIKRPTVTLQWLSFHLLCLTIWASGEMLARLSDSAAAIAFWSPISIIGSAFVPPSMFMFVMWYTDSKWARKPWVFLVMFSSAMYTLFVDLRTPLIDHYAAYFAEPKAWGYVVTTGEWYWLLSLWFLVIGAGAVLQLYSYRKRQTDERLRRQSLLFMGALTLPLTIGGVSDGLLPAFHIYLLPQLAPMLTAAMGVLISYSILRYRYVSFTSQIVADQIVATMREAVIGVQRDMRISYVNPGAERMFGMSAKQLAEHDFMDFLTQRWTGSEITEMINRRLANGTYANIDSIDFKSINGQIITAKLSISKLTDGQADQGYLMVITDISEIAQATAIIERQVAKQTAAVRQAKAQLDSSINSLELGFIITDDRPEVIMVNQPAHRLFCGDDTHTASACPVVTLEHIKAKHIAGSDFIRALKACLKDRKSQSLKSVEFNHRSWRVFISPVVEASKATGTAIVFQDVTEEQILQRSRDEFFSIASHELRTPLTAIKGSTSMMLQYFPEAFRDNSLHEMVDDIHESSNRLISIVNDFLDASRLEQGRISYDIKPFAIVRLIEQVMNEMHAAAQQKGVSLKLGQGLTGEAGAGLHILADAGRVKQILYNLIGNALKFTDSGSITLEAEEMGDKVCFRVVDTGHGIADDMQSILFHKFQQANVDPLTRDAVRGTGLGLYISRLLAKGMHGDLTLESSALGDGSTFKFTLPKAKKTTSNKRK